MGKTILFYVSKQLEPASGRKRLHQDTESDVSCDLREDRDKVHMENMSQWRQPGMDLVALQRNLKNSVKYREMLSETDKKVNGNTPLCIYKTVTQPQ